MANIKKKFFTYLCAMGMLLPASRNKINATNKIGALAETIIPGGRNLTNYINNINLKNKLSKISTFFYCKSLLIATILAANCKFDFLNEKDTKGALLCMSIDAILGYLSSKLDEKFFNKDETNLGSNDKN